MTDRLTDGRVKNIIPSETRCVGYKNVIMKKIIENYTNRILDIWKKIVETPILYICLTFSSFLIRIKF